MTDRQTDGVQRTLNAVSYREGHKKRR